MNPASPPPADLALSLAALIGLAVLGRVLRAAGSGDPLVRRFRFGLAAIMVLFAGRVLTGLTGWGWLRSVEYLGAGLIPLAVLLLTEGLLRRHAPPWAKALVAGGSAVVVVVAVLPSGLVDPGRIWLALVLQVVTFLIAGGLVLTRDRASLSEAENRAAERLALSLLLVLPLGASDFLIVVFGLPARLSGVAVLVLCWLAIGLWRGAGTGHRAPLLTFAGMVLASAGATLALATGSEPTRDTIIIAGALTLAAVLMAAVIAEGQGAVAEARAPSILADLAGAPGQDPQEMARRLAAHPAVAGAVLVGETDLAGLDDEALRRLFAARPVLRRREPPPAEPDLADLCSHLFARYDATHIMSVRRAPRLLLALSLPSIGAGSRLEAELEVAQRMAALMEAREA